MAEHNDLGKLGEEKAKQHLLEKDYTIIAQNWTIGQAEIDIIAEKDGILIFVEVKTRTSDTLQAPEMAITQKKAKILARAANAYVIKAAHEGEVRFDVISIVITGNKLTHFEDAFYPNWGW